MIQSFVFKFCVVVSLLLSACTLHRPMTEADIRAIELIEQQVQRDPALSNNDIEVSCSNGQVRLRGVVDSYAEKKRLMSIAASTPSVQGVQANIFVK